MAPGQHNARSLWAALMAAALATACEPPPPPPLDYLREVPLEDGDPTTDARGYAQSRVNATSYRIEGLLTVGQQQFAAYYHHDASLVIARRTLGSSRWEIFKQKDHTSRLTDDHHLVISFGIDGDAVMHVCWGMHGGRLRYARSVGPVTGQGAIELGPDEKGMTRTSDGQWHEVYVTYPQFIHLPGGDLLFAFRSGISGDGDYYLNRYDTTSRKWSVVASPWLARQPAAVEGLTVSAYINRPVLDPAGNLHVTWTWRGSTPRFPNRGGIEMNHNLIYAWSPDQGRTWKRQDGQLYQLPITERTGHTVLEVPRFSYLANMTGMALDSGGDPLVASWWAPRAKDGDYEQQYMLVWREGSRWHTSQISDRTVDTPGKQPLDTDNKKLGRPLVLAAPGDRALVVYRDDQDGNGITVAYTDAGRRKGWRSFELTTADLGIYEPVHDPLRWQRDGILSLLVQAIGPGEDPTPLKVVEWDARKFFADWAAL